jgi:hypothetical protein
VQLVHDGTGCQGLEDGPIDLIADQSYGAVPQHEIRAAWVEAAEVADVVWHMVRYPTRAADDSSHGAMRTRYGTDPRSMLQARGMFPDQKRVTQTV